MSRAWLWLVMVIFGLSAGVSHAQETSETWSIHTSEAGGYVVDYPPAWVVEEHLDDRGVVVTVFSDPDGRSMMVSAQANSAVGPQFDSDLPHVRCQMMTVGSLTGQRCSDTLSRSTITTLVGPERTYTFVHPLLSKARADFDRVLDSFRLLAPEQIDPAAAGE
jgi:hypothetical protein